MTGRRCGGKESFSVSSECLFRPRPAAVGDDDGDDDDGGAGGSGWNDGGKCNDDSDGNNDMVETETHQFWSVGQRPRFSVSLCPATTCEVCWREEPGVAWSPKWQKKSREAVSPPCIGSHPALSLPRCCHTTPQTNPNKPS